MPISGKKSQENSTLNRSIAIINQLSNQATKLINDRNADGSNSPSPCPFSIPLLLFSQYPVRRTGSFLTINLQAKKALL